jgi:hypothetical protein
MSSFVLTEGSLSTFPLKTSFSCLQKDPYNHPVWNLKKKQVVSKKIEVFRKKFITKSSSSLRK